MIYYSSNVLTAVGTVKDTPLADQSLPAPLIKFSLATLSDKMVTLEIITSVPQVYKACRIYDHRGVIIVQGQDGRPLRYSLYCVYE